MSPQRQLVVLGRINELVREGSQFVIATHSPILMAHPDATMYLFGAQGIVETAYRDTEHFRVTDDFLADPETAMARLFRRAPDAD